jgi:hypothetical protein
MGKRKAGMENSDDVARELRRRGSRSTAAMVINRNIWTVAAWLVAKHGEAAPEVVSARIAKLRDSEVENSAITSWLQVDQAVYELTRAPVKGEPIN